MARGGRITCLLNLPKYPPTKCFCIHTLDKHLYMTELLRGTRLHSWRLLPTPVAR